MTTHHRVDRAGHPLPQPAPPGPLAGLHSGDRCPRPHCGGLLLLRAVVTVDGTCEELVCSLCARTLLVRVREPYRPMPQARDPRVEALLAVVQTDPLSPATDEPVDLPPALRALVRLDTTTSD